MPDINDHPLMATLEKLAEASPVLKQKLDEMKARLNDRLASRHAAMEAANDKIKKVVDEMCDDPQFQDTDILYGLCVNLVLAAYVYNYADRGKARDYIAGGIDACIDDIDESARKNGMHDLLKKHESALRSGDKQGIKRAWSDLEKNPKFEF